MEIWATVVIAFIVALSTLGATIIQNRYSAKRFEKEFERAIVTYQRERRREVRSEPLIKLRNELARMAVLESMLTGVAYRQKSLKDVIPSEKLQEQLLEAQRRRDEYLESGNLQLVLNMQTD